MSTVKTCLSQKTSRTYALTPASTVVQALQMMRVSKIRSVMVMEGDELLGIVTQGDCAIKVLLPQMDPTKVTLGEIMTRDPITVGLSANLDQCMKIMMTRSIRHLPVVDAGKVIGMVSIGDIVKDIMKQQGELIKYLETYIKGHAVEY